MYAPTTFTEWVRNNRTNIEAALELAVIDWLKTQDVGFDDNFIDLDDNHHGLAGEGENKGKVSYCGSIQTNVKGVPYATCTVSFRRASEPNRTFKDSYEVVRQMWEDYKAGDDSRTKRAVEYQQAVADERKRREAKAKDEAARKAANVKREIAVFGGLSNDPRGDQDKYLRDKDLVNAIERGTVRYGSDDKGNYTAILLIEADSLGKPAQYRKPVGVQRFYDRNIKGRNTNKDFTWGMKKAGACYLLGEIDKDYAGLLSVCEGFADGVVAHYRGHLPVLVGADAGNVPVVAQIAKQQIPNAQILTICDNDAHKYRFYLENGKKKGGYDNAGVLNGVQAAINTKGKYVIPDFTGLDQSYKPKDLWDLLHLGGDEAVDKLLSNPQSPPENWDEFRLNYLGLESFWKEVDRIIKSHYSPDNPNPRKAIEAALEFAKPHLGRLGIDEQAVLDRIDEVVPNAEQEFLKRGIEAHNSRLAKANEEVHIERDLKGIKPDNYRTLVAESGLGTGKTQWILLNIFQNPRFERILIITPRKVLAIAFSRRLSATYYEDVKAAPVDERHYMMDRLVAVSNSLKKIGFTGNERYDAVVLDEVELNILHVFGGTFSSGERENTLNILKGLIKNAGFVFCCQAQITKLTLDFLRDSGRFDAHVIRNKSQRYEGFPVELLEQKADCAVRLMQCIEKGEPVIVPCTSSTFVKGLEAALKQKYPDKRISAVHSDNSDDPEPKKILEDPNKNTIGIDALLHSPVLEQGVSIDNGWFKHEVGFCDAGDGIGAPDSFVQMMFRARHILDAAIWADPRTEDKTTDYVKILADERANFEVTKEALVETSDGELTLNVSLKVTKNDVLRAKAQAATNAAKNHTKAEAYAILHEMGCNIKNREWIEVDNEAGEELLKEGKRLQKQIYETSTVAAPQITRPDYEKLRRASASTSDDAAKMKRHKLEKYMAVDLGAIDEDERRNVFDFWKDGRGLKKLDRREIMALSKKQALAYAEYLLYQGKAGNGFWVRRMLLNWVLESYSGRFDDEGRLEGGGRWIVRDDLRGHKTYEWIKDNREVINSVGLGKIRGSEPTDDELGLLITATGLPIESKRVDEDKLDEYVHKNVNGDQKSVQGSPSSLYKNKGTPAQKMITIENRKLVSVFTIDQSATVLKPPKATDDIGMRVFRWLVGALGVLVGLRVLDDGRVECDADKVFRLDDLRQGQDYQWILDNRDAINKAKLGARIKDDAPSNKALGLWLRKFGFKLISKRVSDKSAGKEPQKQRKQITISRLNPDLEHDFLKENLPRRLKTGDLYYRQAAQDWLDQKAQEIAEFGAPLIPNRPVSQATARLTLRYNALNLLRIRSDGRGGYNCEPDFPFTFKWLLDALQERRACEPKDVINRAGLGAKFTGDAPSPQVLTAWIKVMGIRTIVKKIDARKLLNYKEVENETQGNTGGDPVGSDTSDPPDHVNKTVGGKNNSSKNNELKDHKRRMVNAHFIDPKCLPKVREIMDKDEHDRSDDLLAAIMEDAQKPQNILEGKLMEYLDRHRGEYQYVTDLANMLGVKMRDLDPIVAKTKEIECRMDERGKSRIRLPDPFEGTIENPDPDPWGLDDDTPY